jgi:hypothetical protein
MSKNVGFQREKYTAKSRDEYILQHDDALILQPGTLTQRKRFVEVCNWTPEDGPCECVFSRYPRGHRAFWSARWSIKGGMWDVDRGGFPLDQLTANMVICEAEDVMYRTPQDAANCGLTALYLDWSTESVGDYSLLLDNIKNTLRRMRQGYPEFSGWWSMPDRVYGGMNLDRSRPGGPASVR